MSSPDAIPPQDSPTEHRPTEQTSAPSSVSSVSSVKQTAEASAKTEPASPAWTVFFTPHRAFVRQRSRPRPWLLLGVLIIASLLPPAAFLSSGQMGPAIIKQMKRSGSYDKIPAEKREKALTTLVKVAKIAAPVGAVGKRAAFVLLVALLCFAVLRGERKTLTYRAVTAAVALACFPLIFKDILEALVFLTRGPQGVDLDNTLPSNLAAFIPAGKARVTAAALQTVDLFSIWVAVLVGTGVNIVAGSRSRVPWIVGFGVVVLGGMARVAGALAS